MTRKRKKQFKVVAAQVVLGNDMTVRELSEELGIKDSTLCRWAREHEGMGGDAFPGNGGPRVDEDHGIARPRKRAGNLGRRSGSLNAFRLGL